MRIVLLGGFRVSVEQRKIGHDRWRLRKAAGLVKLLALAPGHRLHRDRALELLWPDLEPGAAANNLHYALHVARQILAPDSGAPGEYLRLRDNHLELCPESPLWIDVEAFEEAAASVRRSREPAAYRAALDLYAGDLLPEDRYEEWAEERREGLRRLYITLLVELGRSYEKRGEHGRSIEAFERVVAADAAHEEAHVALMRLHAAGGQPVKAIAQYERLQKSLLRRFSRGPEAASQRLYKEILRGRLSTVRPSPAVAPPEHEGPPAHNLPAARSSFVGREREMVEIKRALATTRLLILTGSGGCGKTRLALEVARDLAAIFADGAWVVELAPLADAELVPQAVAGALGVREEPARPLLSVLVNHLRDKSLLLVLDNCEHLVDACARLVDALLGSCQRLRILATSREALDVEGEVNWLVHPLSVPDESRSHAFEQLAGYESVRLFAERTRFRLPTFELTRENVGTIAEVCRKLDGIPLAIELATARTAVLAVEQIAERLDDSLGLLTGGSRTAEPRHQTLRATLDWSHELLSGPERVLFRRLSVFAGGWTFEAAEAVGVGSGIEEEDILDLLGRLVDKSLVTIEVGRRDTLRYGMLEPVRQYGREWLGESGETEQVRRRHARHYLALAERAEPKLTTAEQVVWLEKLEAEHDNLRMALGRSLERGESEVALRLGCALWRFWYLRAYLSEGRRWLEEVLSLSGGGAVLRARVLEGVAHLAWCQGDFEQAAVLRERSLKLFRQLGDKAGIAASLTGLGSVARMRADYAAARSLLEEALPLRRELGEKWSIAESLFLLGGTAAFQGDHAAARPLLQEGLELFREVGERQGIADSLGVLGMSALSRGDYAAAHSYFEESQKIMRSLGDRRGLGKTFNVKGDLALNQGDHEAARTLYGDALQIFGELDDKWWLAWSLEGLAGVAAAQGQPARAARMFGATEALRETINGPRPAAHRADYERWLALAREGCGKETFAAAWADGRTMTCEGTIEYALSREDEPDSVVGPEEERPGESMEDPLTSREREVAGLVSLGMTNRQIATELSISERTVHTHVRRILRKLDLASRAQITAWVIEGRSSQNNG